MRYLEAKAARGLGTVDEQLARIGKNMGGLGDTRLEPNTTFAGRVAGTGSDIVPQLQALAVHGGTVTQVMFFHHQFMDHIWAKDYFAIPNGELRALADRAKVTVVAPKSARWAATSEAGGTVVIQAGGVFGESREVGRGMEGARADEKLFSKVEKGIGDRPGRARFDPGPTPPPGQQGPRNVERFGAAPDAKGREQSPRTAQLSGIAAREGQGRPGMTRAQLGQPPSLGLSQRDIVVVYPGERESGIAVSRGDVVTHERGIDRVTPDEEQPFPQQARLVVDMPLGGLISGTTTDLLELGQIAGLTPDEQRLYATAVLGHLEAIGAHTFHEIATAAKNAGVPYVAGDYRSFLPQPVLDLPEVDTVFRDPRFKAIPGIGRPIADQPAR